MSDEQSATQAGIVVSGTGRVAVTPEIASLEVGVSLTGPDLEQAREAAATKIGAAQRYLIGAGVAETDIRTTRLNVHTSFDRPSADSPAREQVFHLSSGLQATIRHLGSAESIVNDLFAEIGDGISMNGLTFGVEDPTTGRAEAIELAFEDARAKAVQLARLAGVTLGPVVSVSESEGEHRGHPQMAMARSAGADIPVAAGQLDQQATVTIRWAISD